MKKMLVNILFAVACIIIFGCSVLAGVVLGAQHLTNQRYAYLKVNFTEDVGTVIKDLTYGDKPLNNYDLYLPADKSRENYSLIFFVHGGGFTGGDKGLIEAQRHGEYLASKGYVVASVNYSLAAEGNGVGILNMYEELMCAANVVVQKSEELGYHLTEMATTGGSAGGCLAMLVAFKDPERLPVPIKMVFEETGPASFDPAHWGMSTDAEKAYFVNSLTAGNFTVEDVGSEAYQKAIDEISPAKMITESTVPIILAYGPKDKLVAVQAKYPLLEALEEHQVPHDYIEFPNSGHGLTGDPEKTEEYYQLMDAYLEKYMGGPK